MNKQEKKYFDRLKNELGQAPQKISRQSRIRSRSFSKYLQFIDEARELFGHLKGTISSNPASGAENCHKKAILLKALSNAKSA